VIFTFKLDLNRTKMKQQTHKHTHPFNGPFSGSTQVSRYQKGKTNLDFTGATDSEWQWHQLGHMQVCTLLQTDNHASTPPLKFFTGPMPFLPPNQQRQSTEGNQDETAYQQKNFIKYLSLSKQMGMNNYVFELDTIFQSILNIHF